MKTILETIAASSSSLRGGRGFPGAQAPSPPHSLSLSLASFDVQATTPTRVRIHACMHVCTLALCLEREFHVFRLPFFITLSRKGQATDLIRRSPRFLQIARFRYKYLRSKGVKEETERTNVGPSFSSCFLLGAFSVSGYLFFHRRFRKHRLDLQEEKSAFIGRR